MSHLRHHEKRQPATEINIAELYTIDEIFSIADLINGIYGVPTMAQFDETPVEQFHHIISTFQILSSLVKLAIPISTVVHYWNEIHYRDTS